MITVIHAGIAKRLKRFTAGGEGEAFPRQFQPRWRLGSLSGVESQGNRAFLSSPVWTPAFTNRLTTGTLCFSDPASTKSRIRLCYTSTP